MEPTSPPPRPLKPSEARLLAALRRLADDEGCVAATKDALREQTGLSLSTLAVAVSGLRDLDLLRVEPTGGARANLYCVEPSDEPSDYPPIRPSEPSDPTLREPSDSVPVDAPAQAPAAATRAGGSPPLTPSLAESGSPDPEGTTRERAQEPSDSEGQIGGSEIGGSVGGSRPIGSLAVAAAMEAARAAGQSIDPALRARIGNAAQQLAKDETVETILAAARRLGEGGFTDLYTAVRALERGAPPPPPPPVAVPEGARLAPVLALFRATWPRAVIDPEAWDRELERIPVEFLLDGVRELARSGAEFAPHWGQVYRTSHRIGVEITERRRSARERADLRARVRAIEES